jgi:hypothetical protein
VKFASGPPATLGSTAAAHARLIVWCRDCRHQVEPDPAAMAERYGAETTRLRRGYEGWWIVERRPGGELLRTWTATIAPNLSDTDAALREARQAAAFPRR